jgi:hypothetical protein
MSKEKWLTYLMVDDRFEVFQKLLENGNVIGTCGSIGRDTLGLLSDGLMEFFKSLIGIRQEF